MRYQCIISLKRSHASLQPPHSPVDDSQRPLDILLVGEGGGEGDTGLHTIKHGLHVLPSGNEALSHLWVKYWRGPSGTINLNYPPSLVPPPSFLARSGLGGNGIDAQRHGYLVEDDSVGVVTRVLVEHLERRVVQTRVLFLQSPARGGRPSQSLSTERGAETDRPCRGLATSARALTCASKSGPSLQWRRRGRGPLPVGEEGGKGADRISERVGERLRQPAIQALKDVNNRNPL